MTCGFPANGKADQRRTMDSTIPLDSIRRLIQRLVRRDGVPLQRKARRVAARATSTATAN